MNSPFVKDRWNDNKKYPEGISNMPTVKFLPWSCQYPLSPKQYNILATAEGETVITREQLQGLQVYCGQFPS